MSTFDPSQFGRSRLAGGSAADVLSGVFSSVYEFWLTVRGGAGPGLPFAPVNTSAPTISGVSTRGQVLTASPGVWTGAPAPTFTYQWRRCDSSGLSCADIGGATGSTYTLAIADIGSTIVVSVTGTNASGSDSGVSAPTAVVIANSSAPNNTSLPTVSGSTVQGQVLTASQGAWTGDPFPTFTYQWRRCDGAGLSCADIGGATASTYTLGAGDVASTIRVVVTGTNIWGSAVATSAATAAITASGGNVAPANTALPTISGSLVQGQVLTGSPGSWTGTPSPTFAYQWRRCNSSGLSCVDIGGATSSTYTLGAGDVASTIVLSVTATNSAGSATAASAATGVVAASGGGVSSITQNGVTFTFDKPYPAGQFVNGDWWVTPNSGDIAVTINSITPALTGSGATTQNGWLVNPTGAQCFDGRAASFSANSQPTLPYAASSGSSIIKAVSLTNSVGVGANVTFLDKAVVLTVLSTAPAADAFRPPYYGTYKPIWRQSQLATGSLPSLAPPGGNSGPSLANVEGRFRQVQLDYIYVTVAGRPNPVQSFHDFGGTSPHVYGENIAIDNCEAILRVCLNDTLAAKQNSINYLVQAGIDWYAVAKAGATVAGSGGGGHQGGRKIVVAFAGWLLGDSDIQAIAKETAGGGFGESQQFYWSASAGGASSHFTGQGAGMALFGYVNPFGKPFPYAGSGAKDIRDSSAKVDGGLATYGPSPTFTQGVIPATTASYQNGLYIDIGSTHAILASTICGVIPSLRAIFNYDTELFYADRLWTFGLWTQPDGAPGRALGTPVTNLHGTLSGGALIASSYASSFGNAMRSTYYTTSLFTG